MPPADSSPRDPREGRRPKDSEFYQIPPDLKKEFEMVMAGRSAPARSEESLLREKAVRSLAKASLIAALAGIVLAVVGPLAAIVLGVLAMRKGGGSDEIQVPGAARAGLAIGVAVLLADAAALVLAWRMWCSS